MTLGPHEFIRRFLIHTLPKGLHRIRHYGLFASSLKAQNLARMRRLLGVAGPVGGDSEGSDDEAAADDAVAQPCPCCGGVMRIIEVFDAGCAPRTVRNAGRDRQLMTRLAGPDIARIRRPSRCNDRLRPPVRTPLSDSPTSRLRKTPEAHRSAANGPERWIAPRQTAALPIGGIAKSP